MLCFVVIESDMDKTQSSPVAWEKKGGRKQEKKIGKMKQPITDF
jgi:hypothetical protein